jgi:hypothetical protein
MNIPGLLHFRNYSDMKYISIVCGLLFTASTVSVVQGGSSQRIALIGSQAPSFKALQDMTVTRILFCLPTGSPGMTI